MLKVIGTIRRKAGMSQKEFRDYYESHHALLMNEVLGDFAVDYRRSYVAESSGHPVQGTKLPDLDVDCVSVMWLPDRHALAGLVDFMARPEIKKIVENSEAAFMDRTVTRYVIGKETPDRRIGAERPNKGLLVGIK